ncbi:MAG: ATP synthase F0 subunit B [Acidobacteria bacterium]|nr:MAG: ATP synthase F0 subunit B [Acidobacteriota bacterium]
MRQKAGIGLLVMAMVSVASVWAAEEGEVNLFAGDIGNAIWTLVIFLAVILVLGKFAWGPMLSGLQRREQFIRDSLEQAKQDREAAEAQLAEYRNKLDTATTEAHEIVEKGRRDAEEVKVRIEERARSETDLMVERAKREIDLAKQAAVKELYETGIALGSDIASRVLGREISAQDHEDLISESIDQLEELDSN